MQPTTPPVRVHLRRSVSVLGRLSFVLSTWLFAAWMAFPIAGAQAQQSLIIAATVNDEMISILDVESRLRLSIFLSKLPDTNETRRRLAGQTLRSIIDDKLKLQEAKKFNISVDQHEIERSERDFEKRNGMRPGALRQLMKRLGVDPNGFAERLEAEIAWSRFILARYRRTIEISEQEVDDYLAEIMRDKGKPEYLVSEIFLPTGGPQNPQSIQALADRLIQQIKSGADFGAVARNFSQSATAAQGGSLGWHTAGQLATEIDTVVRSMSPGQIAGPVKTIEGYYILRLDSQRTADPFHEEADEPTTVTLSQAHFELPENADAALVASTMAKAQQISAQATSCAQLDSLAKQTGSPLSGPLGTFPMTQLSAQLRSVVEPLAINRASAPVRNAGGVIVVMVCNRKEPEAKKIDPAEQRARIRNQLLEERINLVAEQYLRNLRRTAIVDVRL